MTTESFTKILFGIVAAMLFVNILFAVLGEGPASVDKEAEGIRHYLTSTWDIRSGAQGSGNDPYVTGGDTGKVAENKAE